MLYKIVVDNLNKVTTKNSKKTIAQAMIDGDILDRDLVELNTTIAFPANSYNRLKLPEGQYSSQNAMMQFIRTIGPYLSDWVLYKITHKLANIETMGGMNTQAFRNSTLAKGFMAYELERHANGTETDELPDTFLAHMKEFILPLCQKNWPDKLEKNFNTFAYFNISSSLLASEVAKKYTRINVYKEVMQFDENRFDPDSLSTSPQNKSKIKFKYQWLEQKSKEEEYEEEVKTSSSLKEKTSKLPKSSDFPISEPSNFKDNTHFFVRQPAVIKQGERTLSILNRKIERFRIRHEANSSGLEFINKKLGIGGLAKIELLYKMIRNSEDLTKEERDDLQKFSQKLLNEIKSNRNTIEVLEGVSENLENKLSI